MQRGDWAGASEALRRGLDKGRLKAPGNAQLLLSIASYSQKKPQEARTWFQRARARQDPRPGAEGWLRHIEQDLAVSG